MGSTRNLYLCNNKGNYVFFKFVKFLRVVQKVLIAASSLVVGILTAINHYKASGEVQAQA